MSRQPTFTAEAFGDEQINNKKNKSKSTHIITLPNDTNRHKQPQISANDSIDIIAAQNGGVYDSDSLEDKELESFIGWEPVKVSRNILCYIIYYI